MIRLYSYKLKTSLKNYPLREGLILNWNHGWGEIAPLPGVSSETLDEALEELIPLLPKLDFAKPHLPSVRFGLSAARTPFSFAPLKIPLCAFQTPRKNFSYLKLKLHNLSIKQAIKQAKIHCSRYRLRLDCNRAWRLDEALFFASHFSQNTFDYLEEPLGTIPELIEFSKRTCFPIAIDEWAREKKIEPSEHLLKSLKNEIPTLKAVVVKPTAIGTIPEFHLPISLSSSYESSLGLLQIGRKWKNSLPCGLDTFQFFAEDLLVPPLQAKDGFLTWSPTDDFPIDLKKLCLIHSIPS
jgi:O-succinylbenzoate synthase